MFLVIGGDDNPRQLPGFLMEIGLISGEDNCIQLHTASEGTKVWGYPGKESRFDPGTCVSILQFFSRQLHCPVAVP